MDLVGLVALGAGFTAFCCNTKEVSTSAAPDRKALNWQKRNEWFGSSSTKDRIMTQAAMVIHKELIDTHYVN